MVASPNLSGSWSSLRRVGLSLLGLACVALASGCGNGSDAGNPDSHLTVAEAKAPLDDATPVLTGLRDQANTVLDDDADSFDKRLAALQGTPIVINAWASWCGPCRFEFPFFQSQAIKHERDVAFIGLDVTDDTASAKTFLSELPLPYPSYSDPGGNVASSPIAKSLDVGPGLPNTIFIGSDGKVVYHWRGGYSSEAQLAEQIEEYAH